jgi:6-phosphogluconolactonase/glucosamine-6-phosphate isomerase/deaminase
MPVTEIIGKLALAVERTPEDAALCAGTDISAYLADAKKKRRPTLLLASGGTALSVFQHIKKTAIGANLTVSVLDERYDPTGRTTNSRALSSVQFFKDMAKAGIKYIDVAQGKKMSPEDVALGFEKKLRAWVKGHPTGSIVAIAGIGPDGHTAGIMPYPEDQTFFKDHFQGDAWISAYNAGNKSPFHIRITATQTLIARLDKVFIFATGEGKAEALRRFKQPGHEAEIPARMLKQVEGTLYTDRALYNMLTKIVQTDHAAA